MNSYKANTRRFNSGSRSVAGLIIPYCSNEPRSEDLSRYAESGIYIGRTDKFADPVFLNLHGAVNPHIFVAGISGSGKSFMMKNLMLRMSNIAGYSIVILDFTGEYRRFTEYSFCTTMGTGAKVKAMLDANKLLYADLSCMPAENLKVKAAERFLGDLIDVMRKFKADSEFRLFIFLDEAWKIIKKKELLETFIREGRKYGVGLIMGSQILDDIDRKVSENIGTIFVFRMQNADSLEKLSKDYSLTNDVIARIQELGVGSCLQLQLLKSEERTCFFIRKVGGVEFADILKICIGAGMYIEVEENEFYEFLDSLEISKEKIAEIKAEIEKSAEVDLEKVIMKLLNVCFDRKKILNGLRQMGLKDSDIADAFSNAVSTLYNT